MLLSFIVHTHSLRYWLPATVMLGTAPAYVLSWGVWRLLSSVLPARLYHRLDDRLYCIYQSMVLFFFENYTGVEVSRLLCACCCCSPKSSEGLFLTGYILGTFCDTTPLFRVYVGCVHTGWSSSAFVWSSLWFAQVTFMKACNRLSSFVIQLKSKMNRLWLKTVEFIIMICCSVLPTQQNLYGPV